MHLPFRMPLIHVPRIFPPPFALSSLRGVLKFWMPSEHPAPMCIAGGCLPFSLVMHVFHAQCFSAELMEPWLEGSGGGEGVGEEGHWPWKSPERDRARGEEGNHEAHVVAGSRMTHREKGRTHCQGGCGGRVASLDWEEGASFSLYGLAVGRGAQEGDV
jgi:hypothetical protein